MVGDRTGAAARLPVLRHGRRQPALRQGRRHRRRDVGGAAGGRGRRLRRAHTPTGWRCGSPRAASTSPAVSGNGWRSRGPSSAGRPIYLFDDAFSALDVHTDARVRAALREVSADSTVVIVSQRISTVAEADQIIVIDDGRVVGVGTHETLLADCPTYAEFADSQSVGAGSAMTGPMTRPIRGGAGADGAVPRLQGLGDPAGEAADPAARADRAVILLGIGGIAIGVIGPRILGHATDLLFNGVIGRQLPAGPDQGAGHRGGPRPRRQHVRRSAVGHERGAGAGRGLRRRRPHPAAGAWAVSDCRAAGLAAGPDAQRRGAAHDGGAALRRRGQGAPDAVVLLRLPPARRGAQPGHQRRRQHPDVAVDDDQPAADLGADRASRCW